MIGAGKNISNKNIIRGQNFKKALEFWYLFQFKVTNIEIDGIPKLYFSGTEGDYNVLVIELLGPNLEDILNYCESKLSLKTVIMIADQLIQRMESVHNRGFLHRDIKSDNFLIGTRENINRVYAIDFGLSKRYVHPHTGEHISMKKHKGLIGTARFASLNAHLGLEQSRRDDLQAVGYLIVYLAKGSLPWQRIKAKTKQHKYKKILDVKDSYTSEALTTGLPEEFAKYLNYVKRLEFEEKPDYHFMRSLFISLLLRSGLQYDFMFDWMISKKQRQTYRRKIKKKFKSQQVKDEQIKKNKIDSSNNITNQNNLQQSTQVENNHHQMNILANDINALSNIEIEKKFEAINVVQVKQLGSPSNQKMDSILENEDPKSLNSIQLKNTVQLANVLNNFDLQIIPERKEEQVSEESRISALQFKNTLKMKSDINIATQQRRFNFSPVKQRLNLKVPMEKRSFKLTKKFRSAQHFQIKRTPQMSQKLVSQYSNELSGFDELGDIDENVEDDNAQIYQFLIHSSKLESEKNLTPSPTKKHRMFDDPNLLDLQCLNNLAQSHKQKIYKGFQGPANYRKHGKSFDNTYQVEDENNGEKGSSMETEFEVEYEEQFEENKTKHKIHLINTSSEESVSNDSPFKNMQDVENNNDQLQKKQSQELDQLQQQYYDNNILNEMKQYDSTIVIEHKKQYRNSHTIQNYRKLLTNNNEPVQNNVHEQRIDESDEDNSDYSGSVQESEATDTCNVDANLNKLEDNKQCIIF